MTSKDTELFFDQRVEQWEKRYSSPRDYWYRRNVLGASWIQQYLNRPAKCLEVGCAAGQFSELLYRAGHMVFGVDISPGMVDAARRRLCPLGVPEKHLLRCEADVLPFEDDTFDLVSGLDVLPYVQNQPKYIKEVHRVLRPQGRAFFNNVNHRSLFVNLSTIAAIPNAFKGKYIIRGRSWWRAVANLHRTGYSSGGFVDLSKAVQARSADMLDRFFVNAGFAVVAGYDMFNVRMFDRTPTRRNRVTAWAARHWGWNHFGLYQKLDGPSSL